MGNGLRRRPRSIKELNDNAPVSWSPGFSTTAYIRSVDSLYKQATVYQKERDLENAFVHAVKAAKIALEYLPQHPDWRKVSSDRKAALNAKSNQILDLLSSLKPEITARFEAWEKQEAMDRKAAADKEASRQRAKAAIEAAKKANPKLFAPSPGKFRDSDFTLAKPAGPRADFGHLVSSNASSRLPASSSASASTSATPDPAPRTALAYIKPNTSSPWTCASSLLPKDVQEAATHLANDLANLKMPQPYDVKLPKPDRPPSLAYVSPNRDLYNIIIPSKELSKTPLGTDQLEQGFSPSLGSSLYPPVQTRPPASKAAPPLDPSNRLRPVLLPETLADSFMAIALDNTDKKIETCALLLGTLGHNQFRITTLLVPKQKGTSDTCETTDEELVFKYQDEHDLLTIGWIHTHPRQTCFLSSVDLHTHCSYQLSLPEAIAVVCAPTQTPAIGIFRLTDPPGLDIIASCHQRGFHPHPQQPIYTDADSSNGHCRVVKSAFDIVDLR